MWIVLYVFRVIRCVEITCATERSDKFRVCLFEHGVSQHIGEKEIAALVFSTKATANEVMCSELLLSC